MARETIDNNTYWVKRRGKQWRIKAMVGCVHWDNPFMGMLDDRAVVLLEWENHDKTADGTNYGIAWVGVHEIKLPSDFDGVDLRRVYHKWE